MKKTIKEEVKTPVVAKTKTIAEIKKSEAGDKLVIHNTKVLFYNPEVSEEGYKPSITVDVSDVLDTVNEFCEEMYYIDKKTKEKSNMDVVREYEGTHQAQFKLNDYTKINSGVFDPEKIGYGCIISLVVSKYAYEKLGGGISNSVSVIKIISLGSNKDEELLSEDIQKTDDDINVDEMFAEK
jgi:hypothetical protein